VVVLGVAGLAYKERQAEAARNRAQAAQKDKDFAAANAEKPKEEPQEAPEALLDAALAPAPSPSGAANFHSMPDGSPVPALPDSAPSKIKLGVVLFRYQGVQGSSDSTRSRESALALAEEAALAAKDDFAAAVKKGDRGSSENIGWMKQRILERTVEHAVFSLKKGEISATPIDTPRGFWVAKRLR
jgi:hypothetical protein